MNILNNEDEDPQFIILTEKNKDDFLVWCLTKLWETNLKIDDEFLNYYMELKLKEWVENNHPWLYCYICVMDEFKGQQKKEEEERKRKEIEKKKKEKEEMRPTDINKRRELMASMYEKKFKKVNKKYRAHGSQ